MSFYLSNADAHPTEFEPAEFLDLPSMAEVEAEAAELRRLRDQRQRPTATRTAVTRTYVGAGIAVYWDADRCIHSERCVSGAPAVFDHDARPWVHPDGAPAAEIAAVIDTCPSGALSYTRTDGAPNGRRGRKADESAEVSTAADPELAVSTLDPSDRSLTPVPVTITPQANGPLVIDGAVALTRPDGSTAMARRLSLCRCGQSGSKPNCDGSHARVGFLAPGVEA